MDLWNVIQPLLVAAAIFLAGTYVVSRVKAEAREGAREGTERALADYRHEQDKALARIDTDHQRRLQEFGFYTRKQHQVYASIYAKVRVTADRFSSLIGITIGEDFSVYSAADVRSYAQRNDISASAADPVIEAYTRSVDRAAIAMMQQLDRDFRLWKAEEAFRITKNAEAVDELYLSDDVRSRLALVRKRVATVSTALQFPESGREVAALGMRDDMNAAVMELYDVMRGELRRGQVLPAAGAERS